MSLKNLESIEYGTLRLNKRLKQNLVKILLRLPLSYPVIVDEDVYPDTLLYAKADQGLITSNLDSEYIRIDSTAATIALGAYLNYLEDFLKRQIEPGSVVTLKLDGKNYIVKKIDHESKSAIIAYQQKGILMRVPLSVLELV